MYDQSLSPLLSEILKASEKHKVFVSFHNADQYYRTQFDTYYGEHFISKSVDFGDIEPDNSDEYIKQLIQEEHITDSSIIVALYGANTWQRKHVDWEISAALMAKVGGHSGMIVFVLPTFPVSPYDQYGRYDERLLYPYLHPRTTKNLQTGYATLLFWPGLYPNLPAVEMKDAIQTAFDKRLTHKHLIDNSHPQYQNNR